MRSSSSRCRSSRGDAPDHSAPAAQGRAALHACDSICRRPFKTCAGQERGRKHRSNPNSNCKKPIGCQFWVASVPWSGLSAHSENSHIASEWMTICARAGLPEGGGSAPVAGVPVAGRGADVLGVCARHVGPAAAAAAVGGGGGSAAVDRGPRLSRLSGPPAAAALGCIPTCTTGDTEMSASCSSTCKVHSRTGPL